MLGDIKDLVELITDVLPNQQLNDLCLALDEQIEFEGACPLCKGQFVSSDDGEEEDEDNDESTSYIDHDPACPIVELNKHRMFGLHPTKLA